MVLKTSQLADTLVASFGKLETIPLEAGRKLIGILETAPDEALKIIINRKVKFCWMIAKRILRDRKEGK